MKYKISQLAKMLDVSTNTVRRYETMEHIKSVRDENNGYRYYRDEDFITVMSIKTKKQYGFTHTDLVQMKEYSIEETIESYKEKQQSLEQQITYLTEIKQKLDEELVLMGQIQSFPKEGERRECEALSYVLFPQEAPLLKDKKRIKKVYEYLHQSAKGQMIYLIRKEDVLQDTLVLHKGCAVKTKYLEELKLQEDHYTERYEKKEVLCSLLKIPQEEITSELNGKQIHKLFLQKALKQLEEKNYELDGDIVGVRITTAIEAGESVEYVLLQMPYVEKQSAGYTTEIFE